MNKKGQALVEFILILPIFIFILLAIVDIGKINIMKSHLETLLKDVDSSTNTIKDKEYEVFLTKKNGGKTNFLSGGRRKSKLQSNHIDNMPYLLYYCIM